MKRYLQFSSSHFMSARWTIDDLRFMPSYHDYRPID